MASLLTPQLIWASDLRIDAMVFNRPEAIAPHFPAAISFPGTKNPPRKSPASHTPIASNTQSADDPFILIPTGGSSGQIKFAQHTWFTLTASAQGFCNHFAPANEISNSFCVLPLHHVSGLMQAIRVCLSGGQLIVANFKNLLANGERISFPACHSNPAIRPAVHLHLFGAYPAHPPHAGRPWALAQSIPGSPSRRRTPLACVAHTGQGTSHSTLPVLWHDGDSSHGERDGFAGLFTGGVQ